MKDDYVEACAEETDAAVAMSSATLTGAHRIINQSLYRQTEPPWGEIGADEWRNRSVKQGIKLILVYYRIVSFGCTV